MVAASLILIGCTVAPIHRVSSTAPDEGAAVAPKQIEVTEIASQTPPYAIFASHRQMIVPNARGIFVVYSDSNTDGPNADQAHSVNFTWVLQRSVDGGHTFSTVYRSPSICGKAPSLETDEDDNIYIFSPRDLRCDGVKALGSLVWMKFLAADNYKNPATVSYRNDTGAGKSSTLYDRSRHQFYFLGYGPTPFMVLNMNGGLIRQYPLFKSVNEANVQYPHMQMDGSRLYVAVGTDTSVCPASYLNPDGTCAASKPWRHGISFIYSDDGGITWSAPGHDNLSLPIDPDNNGPTAQAELAPYANDPCSWLQSFLPRNGKIHFMFQAGQKKHQLYDRFNIAPFAIDLRLDNDFKGRNFNLFGFDGFFTRSELPNSPLYAVSTDQTKYNADYKAPMFILRSRDNGATWEDFVSTLESYAAYYVVGPRIFRSQDRIMGMFSGPTKRTQNGWSIYFFHVTAERRKTAL